MFVIIKRKMIIIYFLIIVAIAICIFNLILNFIINKRDYKVQSSKINYKLKIVHLSDIHGVKTNYKKNKMIKIIKDEAPNLIFITGDLIDSTDYNNGKYPIERTLEFICEITKLAPVYFVYGNHEIALIDDKTEISENFIKKIKEFGVIIINNEVKEITIEENVISLIGIQDPRTINSYEEPNKVIEDELKFVLNDNETKGYKILLSHRPECFELYSEYDVDLCLTGHAHGGQFRFPFIKGLFAPSQGLFPKYTKGEYNLNNTKMIVSPGLGNSIFKLRIFNPLEVGIISIEK